MIFDLNAYQGKTVLVTGHTGFKGSWMSTVLVNAGAKVIGYSSCSKTEERLFDLCGVKEQITHIQGDVRDLSHLLAVFAEHQPEIVIQAQMGGSITAEEILARVYSQEPTARKIYVKPEENKALKERIETRHGHRQLSYMKELGMGND